MWRFTVGLLFLAFSLRDRGGGRLDVAFVVFPLDFSAVTLLLIRLVLLWFTVFDV